MGGRLKPRPLCITPGNDAVPHCIAGWVDPRACLGGCGKYRPLSELHPRISFLPYKSKITIFRQL
jgi:hypothetical protein